MENIGNTPLRFLEIFRTDTFQDVSLSQVFILRRPPEFDTKGMYLLQWLALTPPAMVKATLNLDDETLSHLNKVKQTVIGPSN